MELRMKQRSKNGITEVHPARNGMATVTHYIRSEYRDDYAAQADTDKPQETGPVVSDDALDPWQAESSSAGFHASRRLAGAPKFVPALLPYDEWGDVAAPATYAEPIPTAPDAPHGDVASWYRSLSRQGPSPTQPQHNSSATRHQTSEVTTPKPSSSSSSSPSIAARCPSASPIHATGAPLSSSSSPRLASRRQHWHRRGRDWFISRALSLSQSTSAPPSPHSSSSTLVDMLSRNEPSTAQPLRPPVFLHLGPSNKGWAMLQNQGWSEGEALGAGRNGLSSNDTRAKETLQTKKKRTRLDYLSPSAPMLPTSSSQERVTKEEQQEQEIIIDDDDDYPIVEVRKKAPVPVIDLTLFDTEDEREDDKEDKDDPLAPAPATLTDAASSSVHDHDHDPRAAQTALLTPLPTILKSDRLGIGLKAKTEGPYRASVKRRDAARNASAAAAEDMRRRVLLGKGHRAFARAERLERERRQNMMAYLSEP